MADGLFATGLQLRLLLIEAVALVVIMSTVFGHAFWLRWRARCDGPLLSRAHASLVEIVSQEANQDQPIDPELVRSLKQLSPRQQIMLLTRLASSLDGGQRSSFTALARDLGLIARAEQHCRSRLWWRRLYGCRLLTLLGGGETVVPALLNDRQPEVRAQAATWAAGHPDPAIIDALLEQLATPSPMCRFAIQDALLRLGGPVIDPLAEYLARHDGREVEAALEVAIGLADPRLLAPALVKCRDAEPRVRALAASVIGALGGEETLFLLRDLLDDPAEDVRAAAAEALGRLGDLPSAPALALRLRDRAWEVRRASGLALRQFGAPGLLYLRRALSDTDPYAADMARQLLDISALAGEVA
jgi:HEAT repeat protein